MTRFIEGMAARDLPLHVLHFDCVWMQQFNRSDLQWDRHAFPNAEGMLRRLSRGLHTCVWINTYIANCF